MMVCSKCLVEMRCKKTGVFVRWRKEFVKAGDLMSCPECGSEVVSIHESTEGFDCKSEIMGTLIFEMKDK